MSTIKAFLAVIFAGRLCLGISHPAMAYSQVPSPSTADYQRRILYYVNQYRIKHHLPLLAMRNAISEEAARHSRAMERHVVAFGHTGFYERIKRVYHHLGNCQGGAENVAYYRLDAKRLVDGWIASSGHRRNILGNYNLTGIGIAYGKKGWAYYTQIFIRQR